MTSTASTPSRQTRRPLVLAGLVLAMFVSAIEATIVATAMPSIVSSLGGLELYSWVFSGFLLMQALTIPIYGKLADLFGRKRVFMAGNLIFLVGSVLCALGQSMSALVAYRLVQGFGAGAIQSLATTLVGDLYTLQERGRVQGYMASVWGISAIVGPVAGGLIVQHAHWSWVFWINIPFGIAAITLVSLYLHEQIAPKKVSIDYPGAGLMLACLLLLMLGFTQGRSLGLAGAGMMFVFAAALFRVFVGWERRASDPVIHLELWHRPVIALGNIATFAAGIAMIGVISFMPIFLQGVQGHSPFVAGIALCAMSVGWPLASVITGRVLARSRTRTLVRTGSALVLFGAVVIAALIEFGPALAAAGSFIMGAGFGILNATLIVAIQSSVGWSQRGVATASNILMRTLGNTIGAAVFGGVLNLLIGQAPGSAQALSSALHVVLWGVVFFALVLFAVGWFIPESRVPQESRAA